MSDLKSSSIVGLPMPSLVTRKYKNIHDRTHCLTTCMFYVAYSSSMAWVFYLLKKQIR